MEAERAALAGPRFGGIVEEEGIRFAVWSQTAERVFLCLFDPHGERETGRVAMVPQGDGTHSIFMPGLGEGTRYGFRADGPYDPGRGLWFDPDKLLVDPYAVAIDRPYRFDARLAARRGEGGDTAPLMPRAIAMRLPQVAHRPPLFRQGGLIYEVPVKAFSIRHPGVPETLRGTVAALGHPAVIEHLVKLGVSAVELMPVTAWIDERHLAALGLTNAWGYNPVTFMALDPRLAPGGIADLREATEKLREAGIGVILDLVFNHTGESDELGPTLSLRGLDNPTYYRNVRDEPGRLVNDTGTGNTVRCGRPAVKQLIVDSLRHFVRHAGVDGFRFDLAPVLGRRPDGFAPVSPLLTAIGADPVLKDRVLIAEPWDIGVGGYQLGNFPPAFLEWNDVFRDDVRRFWRGDAAQVGHLATRLAGSSDIFSRDGLTRTRTVNFLAAHDGMALADLAAYEHKHNEANGEQNRDGHNENLSWNNGVEGETADPDILRRRGQDVRAMLATLFASRGAIMLTAGDEFGRTQKGNNNAYAQDNDATWLDWQGRDVALEDHVAALSAIRRAAPVFAGTELLAGNAREGDGPPDVEWLTETGKQLEESDWWDAGRRRLSMLLADGTPEGGRLAVLVNGDRRASTFVLPRRGGFLWHVAGNDGARIGSPLPVTGRSVVLAVEKRGAR